MWENAVNINDVREIRSKSLVYFGVGAISKMNDIAVDLAKRGLNKIVIVTGKQSYKTSGAWQYVEKALRENQITYALYDAVTPNPTVDHVDAATKLGRNFGAQAVLSIGGGSPIDAAKSVAILLEYPEQNARNLYEYAFVPEKAVPIVTINLTHGTGTEIDRFAVVSIPEKNYKPYIAADCIYPMCSINDPALCTALPADQTLYVTVDAMNHVIEAATSVAASPYSIMLAKETIRLIAAYLPIAMNDPSDLTARYYLMYAAMIAGISFDNGLLHFTHALEHPLSGLKPELAHGLGLGMIIPAIIKRIYPAAGVVLADILAPIIPGLTGSASEAEDAAAGLEEWLFSLGMTSKLADEGFTQSDIARLTELVYQTPGLAALTTLAPVPASEEVVSGIYQDSMVPISNLVRA